MAVDKSRKRESKHHSKTCAVRQQEKPQRQLIQQAKITKIQIKAGLERNIHAGLQA
ncbi:MAG: hypothetical protein Q7T62_07510 [Undibacterium sp.]|nr:hypothetical protein [Undibacterium sp.]